MCLQQIRHLPRRFEDLRIGALPIATSSKEEREISQSLFASNGQMESEHVTRDNTYYTNILSGATDLDDPFSTFGYTPTTQYSNEGEMEPRMHVQIESSTKKTQRTKNIAHEEDLLLVSAWLNVSLDPIHGNEQKGTTYWNRIYEYWMTEKKFTSERNTNSLLNRWSQVQKSVNKFCGFYAKIEERCESGSNMQDRILKAKEMYQKLQKTSFMYEHCWHALKDQPKWISECSKKKGKASKASISASSSPCTPYAINLEEDNGPKSTCLERPQGKKAAKRVAKQGKASSNLELEIEEFKKQKLEQARKQDEQFQLMYASEQVNIALRREEVELQRRKEDSRIMAMDTTQMQPMQAAYIEGLQRTFWTKAMVIVRIIDVVFEKKDFDGFFSCWKPYFVVLLVVGK